MTGVDQVKAAKMAAVDAALVVAEDIAEGRITATTLEQAALAECRQLVGRVIGPDDPLWPLQVDVARQCLAVGGWITADELAEWVAVYRAVEPPPAPVRGRSWIEVALEDGDDEIPGEGVASTTGCN